MSNGDTSGAVPTIYRYDEHTDETHVYRWQDVEPILDGIARARAHGHDGYNADRSMRAFAEIPITIVEQWRKEGVDIMNPDHWKEVRKRLMDPALRGFRLDLEGGLHNGVIVKGKR